MCVCVCVCVYCLCVSAGCHLYFHARRTSDLHPTTPTKATSSPVKVNDVEAVHALLRHEHGDVLSDHKHVRVTTPPPDKKASAPYDNNSLNISFSADVDC